MTPAAALARATRSPLPLLTALRFLLHVDVRMMTPLLPAMAASLHRASNC